MNWVPVVQGDATVQKHAVALSSAPSNAGRRKKMGEFAVLLSLLLDEYCKLTSNPHYVYMC